ncbi:hypothetical protein O6B72_01985 [Campylobacter ureolyticus]|uniref:hypothetical protein n=1 Tax=Campylobacter ureolyticus TaxID=827 RepID=UPI0022B4C064|nr:hypothetical protein [Campylobacter ureolyticus]MCZ6155592.1 hypothetical protein [Campylobacter ureolyticus]
MEVYEIYSDDTIETYVNTYGLTLNECGRQDIVLSNETVEKIELYGGKSFIYEIFQNHIADKIGTPYHKSSAAYRLELSIEEICNDINHFTMDEYRSIKQKFLNWDWDRADKRRAARKERILNKYIGDR